MFFEFSELYSPLSLGIEACNSDVDLHKSSDQREKYLSAFLQRHAPAKRLRAGVQEDLMHRVYFLDIKRTKRKKFNQQPGKRKTLSSSEKKRLKLFDIKPEEQKYGINVLMHFTMSHGPLLGCC